MPLDTGTMVTANVRLLSPLGEGAMGSVWLAEHLTLETEVAVKFIHDDLQANRDEAVARFRREAAAAAKIRSPHIVQVFDQGQMEDGTPYIVMEMLEGESLEDRLQRVQRLSLRQTAQIVSQVAKGLRAAHAAGIIHRDIKPANVFLVPHEDGKLIKLVDFGVAKAVKMPESRKLTQDGLLVGTPEYICRDQITSTAPADSQTDLWALAVVAYECLIGEVPFGGATIGMVCANIMLGKFALPTSIRQDLPPGIDEWFQRCFAEAPEERFESAREMALAFVRLMPTRTGDIEADLMDRGTSHFSIMPPPPTTRRGTEVGLAKAHDDRADSSLDDSAGSDWGTAEFDESEEALELVARARSASTARATTSSASMSSSSSAIDGSPSTRTRTPLLAAAGLAVAVAVIATWFALRPPESSMPSAASLEARASATGTASQSTPTATSEATTVTAPASSEEARLDAPSAKATDAEATVPAASSSSEASAPSPSSMPARRERSAPTTPDAKREVSQPVAVRPPPPPPPPPPAVTKPRPGSPDELGF